MIWHRVGDRYDLSIDGGASGFLVVGSVEMIDGLWYPMRFGEAAGKEGYKDPAEAGGVLTAALAEALRGCALVVVEPVAEVVPACAKCGATGAELVDLPTGAVCVPCIVAAMASP